MEVISGTILNLDDISLPLVNSVSELKNQNTAQEIILEDLKTWWNKEKSSLSYIESLIKTAEININKSLLSVSDNPTLYVTSGDSLKTPEHIDNTSTILFDPDAGYVTLPVSNIESLTPYINQINVSTESKGRPGDLVTIREISFDSKNNPVVGVAYNPAMDIISTIDGNPSTYYVWENVYVPRLQKVKKQGEFGALVESEFSELTTSLPTMLDIVNESKGFGFKWKGLIPGQGEVEKPLFNLDTKENAVLIIDYTFSDPVPLTSIRITPNIDIDQSDVKVNRIVIYAEDGTSILCPGVPRVLTSISGRSIKIKNISDSIQSSELEGSGIFQFRPGNKLITGVKIEFESESKILAKGAAHPFQLKSTTTNEKASVLGIRVLNKTKNSKDRVEVEGADISYTDQYNLTRNLYGNNFSFINYGIKYNKAIGNISKSLADKIVPKDKKRDLNYNLYEDYLPYSPDEASTVIPYRNYNFKESKVSVLKDAVHDEIERKTTNVISDILNRNLSRNEFLNSVERSVSAKNNLTALIGPKLTNALGISGPLGIVAGAALSGDLFKSNKTTQIKFNSSVDIFKAYRSSISIQDISFDSRQYVESGEFISKEHILSSKIRAVSLYISCFIPNTWPKDNWIETYIKTENTDWIPIKAFGNIDITNVEYQVNIPASERIKIRIKLKRPFEDINTSPILSSYTIKGLPL